MSFIISGDIHGTIDIDKIIDFFAEHEDEYTADDYLIICGDVSACAFLDDEEVKVRKILQELPVTTLFIDGNHEHFGKLNSYAVIDWNGGKVHMITDKIIHLMRGQVFEVNSRKLFTFGGAYSIDKYRRREGISWFPEEIPTMEEYEEGWENLEKADFKVDYIFSHTAPGEVAAYMGYGEMSDDEAELRQYLQRVADNTEFTAWYFGHFHTDDVVNDTFYCLYDELIVVS
ncbi:MAG: metallophosphoesterase [Lachnospiraceae bacterium]|nr:metallophosphoesterase [Lachnospiraceae bacterium]